MSAPSRDQIISNLKRANQVADRAVSLGHHPFGAILVAPDHQTVLLEQVNLNTVEHAESVLARIAFNNYPSDFLWNCTLYTTVEPCAMCSGTQYWANIGRVVYGMSEVRLLELTGSHSENPTMSLPCREVFEKSQKSIHVIGPVEELESEIAEKHLSFWKN
ncbi:zinc-binding CMP/dCMP deaminase [Basidiobolus meristosporus CBS 931.73]|uniref:Zinc-binding CMP/dCMP deaminase n=1 Tax=Basidiobolus meristosporus CBS 931.73 TaxID=1314790 RepID=A0A1Y1YED1_9FUNG|nr:zinc-binding CMP/dCMP deaminase [Basidiobolus meristosporus CBS 931.73]|eukprot:ORX96400.1 zinc-binding CMP/dCMP deaminase [Basidiobolus meristosporus CBS 931.73]